MVNIAQLMKIKGAWDTFIKNHPKFSSFLEKIQGVFVKKRNACISAEIMIQWNNVRKGEGSLSDGETREGAAWTNCNS